MHLFNFVKKILSRVGSLLLILPANVYTRQLRMQSLGNADAIVGEPSPAQATKKAPARCSLYRYSRSSVVRRIDFMLVSPLAKLAGSI